MRPLEWTYTAVYVRGGEGGGGGGGRGGEGSTGHPVGRHSWCAPGAKEGQLFPQGRVEAALQVDVDGTIQVGCGHGHDEVAPRVGGSTHLQASPPAHRPWCHDTVTVPVSMPGRRQRRQAQVMHAPGACGGVWQHAGAGPRKGLGEPGPGSGRVVTPRGLAAAWGRQVGEPTHGAHPPAGTPPPQISAAGCPRQTAGRPSQTALPQ